MHTHTHPFRILLFNVGYCTELDGSFRDYLLRFYRYFHTPKKILRDAIRSLSALMRLQHPDLCCFVELHDKTRDLPHVRAYAYHSVENKYGLKSVLRRLPFFRHNCNGFFARTRLPYRKIFLKHGAKKLIYELKIPRGISLFMVHFSLKKRVRREQCGELERLLADRKKVILCGDFNTLHGTEELAHLRKTCNLRIVNARRSPTFPTRRPRKALDLFLCTPSIEIARVRVLQSVHLSDHLPVLLEIRL